MRIETWRDGVMVGFEERPDPEPPVEVEDVPALVVRLNDLQAAVDQLIIDALLGGM